MSTSNPFNIPSSRQEVADRQRTDVKAQLPGSDPFLKNSFIGALIVGFAGRIYDVYQQILIMIKQAFPNTATGIYLSWWGLLKNIILNPASQSAGLVAATGTVGATIPVNTILSDPSGNQFTVTAGQTIVNYNVVAALVTFSGGIVTVQTSQPHNLATGLTVNISGAAPVDYNGAFLISVTDDTHFTYAISTAPSSPATGTISVQINYAVLPVQSQAFGAAQNQVSGSELAFSSPLAGVDNNTFVLASQIGGGTDIESDTSYQARVVYAYQNPISFFNDSQLIQLVKKVPGVTRVFVQDITPNVGQVTVYFMRDNDASPIPSGSAVTAVKNQILTVRPAHVDVNDVIVAAPSPVFVNFVFASIVPNTPSMQAAILANLQAFFQEQTYVGKNLLAYQYNSVIYRTIDNQTGIPLTGFVLTAPITDIAITSSQIPMLGTVTFS